MASPILSIVQGGMNATWAARSAKLTRTEPTPSSGSTARVTASSHPEQLMPPTCTMTRRRATFSDIAGYAFFQLVKELA